MYNGKKAEIEADQAFLEAKKKAIEKLNVRKIKQVCGMDLRR